jgi:hypothetical protein
MASPGAKPAANQEGLVTLLNEVRPSGWDQVSGYLEVHGTIGNADVRKLLKNPDTLTVSKLLQAWVRSGLLAVNNPEAAKRLRKYERPGNDGKLPFHYLETKIMKLSTDQ